MGLGDFFKDVGHAVSEGVNWVNKNVSIVPTEVDYNPVTGAYKPVMDDEGKMAQTPTGNLVNHQLETVSRGLNWVYSNGISQPISTAGLMTAQYGDFSDLPQYFHGANWAKAWHAANHISLGQALGVMVATDEEGGRKAVDSPLQYYSPPKGSMSPEMAAQWETLSEDEQQDILKQAGMPAVGNRFVENLRNESKLFKYGTGVPDLAFRWWADPVIVAGGAASAVRREAQISRRPTEGWSQPHIDKLLASSVMRKAQEYIYANRENPQLLNNLSMAQNSALGPRFGAIASLLKTPDEVNDFLRVGMGDTNAIERLQMKNALATLRIAQDTERLSALDLMHTRYTHSPAMQAMVTQHMDELSERVNADEALVGRYNQVLDHANELDELNLSRWGFARAEQKTEAQNAYKARTARVRGAERYERITPGVPLVSKVGGYQGRSTPIDLGYTKSRIHGIGDFFSTPITLVRSFKNFRPNGYMRVDDVDADSINELRAQAARVPGISEETRAKIVNEYMQATTDGERLGLLHNLGQLGAAKVAEKHGLDAEAGLDIYREHLRRQFDEIDNMKRYSAARKTIQLEDGTFAKVHVDEFTADGGKLVIAPNLVTKLANSHVFQDLAELDKVLARHGSALKALREHPVGNTDWMLNAADWTTGLFKFATLFRLGYIPRVIGDDVAGQWARAGSAAMAARVNWGVRNGATNLALRARRPFAAAKMETSLQGVKYAEDELARLQEQIDPLRAQVAGRRVSNDRDLIAAQARHDSAAARQAAMPATATPTQQAAMQRLVDKHARALDLAKRRAAVGAPGKNIRLQSLEQQAGFLERYRGLAQKAADDARAVVETPKQFQGGQPVHLGDGVYAPPALAHSAAGDYYMKMISPDETIGQIFAMNKQLVHGHLQRSFDHGGKVITASQDEAVHATSWAHAINAQLAQDELARLAIQGRSVDEMTAWLTRTPEGRAYRRQLGLKLTTADELANAAKADVDHYLPSQEIRDKALEPNGVTPEFLKEAEPNMAFRPEVHTGQVGQAQIEYKRAIDRIAQKWFHFAASVPAKRMSRHPLFNQLYEGHLNTLKNQAVKQGAYDTTVEGVEAMATTARRIALKDMRKLVFDIAHKSDASAALRFVSPFMAPTAESFQRWGRIIAERPQIVGYANNFFNAPLAAGWMQDADGNDIMSDGTVPIIDPKTGKTTGRRLVPKSERFIVGRMPHWLVDSPIGVAMGAERSSGNFKLSQNSINLVTQGDPWFHPGVGPIVQIPVNELVRDKPKDAEIARALGILPFGPQEGIFGTGAAGRAASFVAPATLKNFLTAFDTSDERYQSVKMQIMQRAAFEHSELGKPMPSAQQISDMTRNYWFFTALSSFVQPASTQRKDAYQFFRDQYNALRRANPMTADSEYLARFGESHFIFAQSQSQNVTGAPATMKAVELSEKYKDLLAANPELAALVIGPEGNGPFSPEAYQYQLNHPLEPGGSEMQRTKISATEAMRENQRRLGWAKFTAKMNELTAKLHNAGFKSFDDEGAEDFKADKKAWVSVYAEPLMPDGSPNPHYNEQWSKDWFTLDARKYERLIPGLTALARSPLAQQPNRSDLRVLQTYLGGRQELLKQLAERKASGAAGTLKAKANEDLRGMWSSFVAGLIESDTRFHDLHTRYLARDLGVDTEEEQA
jgi:hypothetical protein